MKIVCAREDTIVYIFFFFIFCRFKKELWESLSRQVSQIALFWYANNPCDMCDV